MAEDATKPFRLRIVSDLHVGSRWGLWPPGVIEIDEERYVQNRYQEWLWERWLDMCTYPKADLLIVNGDLMDGPAVKDLGGGTKTTELDPQQRAAVEVLAPLVKRAAEWMHISGTIYHGRWALGVERALGAKRWPESSDLAGQVLNLGIRGVGVNIAHHPEGGAAIYKGTTMDRMTLWSLIASRLGKVFDANILVRSHHHFYALWQANTRTAIQVPAWQLQTPHAAKHAYFRYQPDIGFVDILLRPEEPYPVVVPVLYPLPPRRVLKIA